MYTRCSEIRNKLAGSIKKYDQLKISMSIIIQEDQSIKPNYAAEIVKALLKRKMSCLRQQLTGFYDGSMAGFWLFTWLSEFFEECFGNRPSTLHTSHPPQLPTCFVEKMQNVYTNKNKNLGRKTFFFLLFVPCFIKLHVFLLRLNCILEFK